MSTYLNVQGTGSFKAINNGFFLVQEPPPVGKILVKVADILANNANDLTQQNYPPTKDVPILFDTNLYKLEVDGSDPTDFDTTESGAVSSIVMFKAAPGSDFFGTDGDYVDFSVNWRNGQKQFFELSFRATSSASTAFARFFIIGQSGAFGYPGWSMHWNFPALHGPLVFNQDVRNALLASQSGDPVVFRFIRLNNSQIRVDILDKDKKPFANPQTSLVCNTPTTQFTPADPGTNDYGVFVGDITHIHTREQQNNNHMDYIIEKSNNTI